MPLTIPTSHLLRRRALTLAVLASALVGTPGCSRESRAARQVDMAFSPGEGALELVLKVIESARTTIRILAYSFTSVPICDALVAARARGVDIKVVADARNNLEEDRSGKALAALQRLQSAGCDIRTISVFQRQHDKVMVVDDRHCELGSFNYTASAAHSNSETVLVVWNDPDLAQRALQHFERNLARSVPFSAATKSRRARWGRPDPD